MQNKFNELRRKHPFLTYEKYEIVEDDEKLTITYYFLLEPSITFTPKWVFHKKHIGMNYGKEEVIHNLAFHLGLVELISYWKCACPPRVIIKAGPIDEEQIRWWKLQYFLGLGEFFYTNRIETDMDSFMIIEGSYEESGEEYYRLDTEKAGCLIPIGGGKDSVVTLELLKEQRNTNLCYMINYKEASVKTAKIAGYVDEEILIVNRSLDSKLLELNKEGYLNGHTPFSAIVAFSSVLSAYLYDKQYVTLSNEASANESTVEGTLINHQYSKSFQFEQDFIEYENKYINSGVHYFSLLRPFSELQIAKYFASNPKYYKLFRSCNVGSKHDLWCGSCSKCLFVYIILSPFTTPEDLVEIFGSDMFDKVELIPTFDKLIGIAPEKPFECVGTCDEANTALCMTIRRYREQKKELPKLLRYYQSKNIYDDYMGRDYNFYFCYYNEENRVPEEFVKPIKAQMLK